MLLELIKYAGSGIIPFLVTISILATIGWFVTDFCKIRIILNLDKKDGTGYTKSVTFENRVREEKKKNE